MQASATITPDVRCMAEAEAGEAAVDMGVTVEADIRAAMVFIPVLPVIPLARAEAVEVEADMGHLVETLLCTVAEVADMAEMENRQIPEVAVEVDMGQIIMGLAELHSVRETPSRKTEYAS